MSNSPNDDRDPLPQDTHDRTTEENELTPGIALPLGGSPVGISGILPVGGMSTMPGSLMGEGGGYGSPLGGAGLYPVLAPLGEMQDAEQELASGVEAALAEDGRLSLAALSTVHVSASVHTVVLEGTVPSESERREAEEIARHVPHVRSVQNRLTVSPA